MIELVVELLARPGPLKEELRCLIQELGRGPGPGLGPGGPTIGPLLQAPGPGLDPKGPKGPIGPKPRSQWV